MSCPRQKIWVWDECSFQDSKLITYLFDVDDRIIVIGYKRQDEGRIDQRVVNLVFSAWPSYTDEG